MLKLVIPVFFLLFEYCAQQNSRRPSPRDHILCNHKLFAELEKIRETIDPKCRAEAYWNRTGVLCATYCRILSRNREVKLKQINATYMFDAPIYENCGQERYCTNSGSCKRLELFETSKLEVTERTTGTTIGTPLNIRYQIIVNNVATNTTTNSNASDVNSSTTVQSSTPVSITASQSRTTSPKTTTTEEQDTTEGD